MGREGRPLVAAELFGAAEVIREGLGSVPVPKPFRLWHDEDVALARSQVEAGAFAAAWNKGRELTVEEVVRPFTEEGGTQEEEGILRDGKEHGWEEGKKMAVFSSVGEKSLEGAEMEGRPVGLGLTARELEVLRQVALGLTDGEVAEKLVVSVRTVQAHLQSVYGKLGVKSRMAAVRVGVEKGLL